MEHPMLLEPVKKIRINDNVQNRMKYKIHFQNIHSAILDHEWVIYSSELCNWCVWWLLTKSKKFPNNLCVCWKWTHLVQSRSQMIHLRRCKNKDSCKDHQHDWVSHFVQIVQHIILHIGRLICSLEVKTFNATPFIYVRSSHLLQSFGATESFVSFFSHIYLIELLILSI